LQLHLEDRLASHFGRRRSIVGLERRPCPYASSFPVDELDVQLADGSELQLVVKDLSAASLSERARVRPDFLYEPRREIQVYRWILPHAPAGSPTWYGAVTNASIQRHWLFLERVPGLELRHVGALSVWQQTARWLARFHAAFRSAAVARLIHTSKLLVYDDAFYWRWLERARRFTARRPRARRILDGIARHYGMVVTRLTNMPHTLIHGEFYPCNIVVHQSDHELRICPVDWEMAAFAPAVIDLASLTTGWCPRVQRALIRAYRAATSDAAMEGPPVPRSFRTDFDCCRLHLAVRMLGWSQTWTPPPQHAFDWLAEAAETFDRLMTAR
jgi:hypothetical protein